MAPSASGIGEGTSEIGGAAPNSMATTAIQATALATSTACKPTFERRASGYDDMFLLTIKFPAMCRWFAKNNERGSVAWWLTAPSSDYKTHRYDNGAAGVGAKTFGVFYRGGRGKTHTLDVCLGDSCDTDDSKVAKYRFTY